MPYVGIKRGINNPDPLIAMIIGAVILAIIFPAQGRFADAFDVATAIAIAALFFLYGARLSPGEAMAGLKHWKLHLLILAFTFVVFPLIGIALQPLTRFLSQGIYVGLLYLTLMPSTVQSSVAFTSVANGNVAGSIVAASLSNLLGVVISPMLVLVLIDGGEGSAHVDAGAVRDIALQLLLPFILGQLTRRWVRGFAARKSTKLVDRGSIAMVVYYAFSQGMVDNIWAHIGVGEIAFLVILSVALVAFMLWLTRVVPEKLGFNRADTIAIEFCGTKKSLASGLPMASVMFAGGEVGLIILPLMIFHQVQLMMCAWLATRYGRQSFRE